LIRLEEGDCVEIIPRLVAEGIYVDAVVTDSPYNLTTIERGHINRDRTRTGFMSMKWDGTGIAFRPETWTTIAAILRPGGFLLAFGGTRTSHRMVCAIEDAGFVIQDTIMWLYGSGFPKGKTMLKPAFEPICLAYKPGGKRTLGVDECRIDTGGEDRSARYDGKPPKGGRTNVFQGEMQKAWDAPSGRWPANVIHDGSDGVMGAFGAFGDRGAQGIVNGNERSAPNTNVYSAFKRKPSKQLYDELGSAARFFYSAKAGPEDRFGSKHPTVKPVELIRYLVCLVTPKGGTFLDPFAGSGTAGVAALAEGRNAILIEREPQYIADIKERLAYYEGEGRHSLASKNRAKQPRDDLPLFANEAEPAMFLSSPTDVSKPQQDQILISKVATPAGLQPNIAISGLGCSKDAKSK
jgi:site-specific DNA-methyltransferase (adenine-specific)